MPRKKTNAATGTMEQRPPRTPLLVRYLTVAVADLHMLAGQGNKAAASALQTEIEEQINFASAADLRAAIIASIQRERQRVEELARVAAHQTEVMYAVADAQAPNDHEEQPSLLG